MGSATSPRCFLRSLYVALGITVSGYGPEDRLELDETDVSIGRAQGCDIRIAALIGGRRTFAIRWSSSGWTFHVNNEWALVEVNGEALEPFTSRVLSRGDEVSIFGNLGDGIARIVHRFRVEFEGG